MKSGSRILSFNRWLLLKQETDRMLMASMSFSVAMVISRIAYTGTFTFIFLIWNLLLAYLPYVLSKWLSGKPQWLASWWKFLLPFSAWLLFLPNSFYIITDLLHLNGYPGMMKWFDLTLIISFAWNGLLLGVLAIRQMEKIVEGYLGNRTTVLFIFPLMALNAFGVYIGRYLRFNSWDVLVNPFQLIGDVKFLILHPLHNKLEWGIMFLFSLFMLLVYVSLKRVAHVIR